MTPTPPPIAPPPPAPAAAPREPRRPALAPDWLQASLILALLGAAVYVALNGHYLWGTLLAGSGAAFGVSFVLRRMVEMSMAEPKRIIVGITGASGAVYARRILEALCSPPAGTPAIEVFLVVSTHGRRLLHDELGLESGGPLDLSALVGRTDHAMTLLPYKDVGAPIASGSFPTDGMVVVPCSNNKLAEMAHGLGGNLIARAANVCLKERRKLIVVHREMPLGLVEIKNMLALTEAGAIICPANPGFYHLPQSIEEVVDTVAARVLDLLGISHALGRRWTGEAAESPLPLNRLAQ